VSAPVLLTAFGPFDRWTENSSEHAARRQSGVAVRILPVDHDAAAAALRAALAETGARTLLMTGLADGDALRLELLARRPAHLDEGAAERRGLWPWAASLDAMRATGAPAGLSRDAGRYVCETTYWHGAGRLGDGLARAAFLHLPPLSAAWPAERLAAAVAACLAAGGAAG
jgi:pyroglutamyl-peptidase